MRSTQTTPRPRFGPTLTALPDCAGDVAAATRQHLCAQGFCLLDAEDLGALCALPADAMAAALPSWDALPADAYLKDGGHYRRRRHASFVLEPTAGGALLMQAPHRAHFQPLTYNALHGGLVRWYEPIDEAVLALPAWRALLAGLGTQLARLRGVSRWFVEAHQFRIDTSDGVGRPTPEGAHRDGVDFVAVLLMQRHAIRGGESRVFELDGARGVRFTLEQAGSVLLLDDTRVMHETTPIVPLDDSRPGWRDTLVLTFRAGGFLDPPG